MKSQSREPDDFDRFAVFSVSGCIIELFGKECFGQWGEVGMVAAILVIGLAAAGAWLVVASNRLKVLLVRLDEAALGIDTALLKRHGTLAKLAEAARPYAPGEIEALLALIEVPETMDIARKASLNRSMDDATERLNGVIQTHPELRASEECLVLQDAIWDSEDRVLVALRAYNAQVSAYNQAAVQLPASLIVRGDRAVRPFFPEGE